MPHSEPYQIRRLLTKRAVQPSNKRGVFDSLEAYETAGDVVMRDLLQQDDGAWPENAGLLDGMVAEKLKVEAEIVAAKGWK